MGWRVVVFWMAVVVACATTARADEAPLPPPPMLSPPEDPAGDPPPPPTDDLPPLPPTPRRRPPPTVPLPAPEPATKSIAPATFGPLWGTSLGALGGALGASAGAVVLVSSGLVVLPEIVLLAVILSTPALASLVAGLLVVAMGVPNPTFDDFGTVAACSAIGCAGTWLVLALGFGGGAGCNPGGCGDPCPRSSCWPGAKPAGNTARKHDSDIGLPAAAGAGLGALLGLVVGAGAGYTLDGSIGLNPDSSTQRVSAATGLVAGGIIGGAIGGLVVGFSVDGL